MFPLTLFCISSFFAFSVWRFFLKAKQIHNTLNSSLILEYQSSCKHMHAYDMKGNLSLPLQHSIAPFLQCWEFAFSSTSTSASCAWVGHRACWQLELWSMHLAKEIRYRSCILDYECKGMLYNICYMFVSYIVCIDVCTIKDLCSVCNVTMGVRQVGVKVLEGWNNRAYSHTLDDIAMGKKCEIVIT